MTEKNKTCSTCDSKTCSAKKPIEGESPQEHAERMALANRMCGIKHKILVLSGKGGVGKSTVAANLAVALAAEGNKVGLLDVDIHGPSVPTMFGLTGEMASPGHSQGAIAPVKISKNLRTMSIGFLLGHPDDALIWRGPMKIGIIQQFLKDVEWGELDYLVADMPPGTGDEPLSICQMIEDVDGAVIVSTPQEVALADVRKSVNFCAKLGVRILGIVENMSGFTCPGCGKTVDIFKRGGAEEMCAKLGVPFAGKIPITPEIVETADAGKTQAAPPADITAAFKSVARKIVEAIGRRSA